MAQRDLPNVYITVNDKSAIIEGEDSLIVGITLRANRGPMNEALNVQDSNDFLTRYTLSGKPGAKQDTTYFDIIELLKVSSNVYVSRSANNPLYGGLLFKKEVAVGDLVGITEGNLKRILLKGDVSAKLNAGDTIRISGTDLVEGNYGRFVVSSVAYVTPYTQVELTEELAEAIVPAEDDAAAGSVVLCKAPVKLNEIVLAEKIANVDITAKSFFFEGNQTTKFAEGDQIRIDDYTKVITDAASSTAYFTIAEVSYSQATTLTTVVVNEDLGGTTLADGFTATSSGSETTGGETTEGETTEGETATVAETTVAGVEVNVYLDSLSDPDSYNYADDDLFLVTGIDQGAYNNQLGVEIVSGNDEDLYTDNAFKLYVYNYETSEAVEEYLVSMGLTQKSIDGSNIHIKNVINDEETGSSYIKIWTPDDNNIIEDAIPSSTDDYIALGGGSDGGDVATENDIEALEVFADKTIPVSLLVNGDNANLLYQSAMLAICEDRKDCFAFLRTPTQYEKLKLPAQRVKSAVAYKKSTLSSTSYLAAIYGPSMTVTDSYNARKVNIGAESVACKKWLEVIADEGYPYAAAGINFGKLSNVTIDWKMGDESSEAESINDASMNFAVYEARQKFYYFNTQNTLQLADSAFRNIGTVLNILGIKERLFRDLKQYVQYPITSSSSNTVREAIVRTMETFLDDCVSSERISEYVINDNTTNLDIAKNQLQYLVTLCPASYAQKIYLVMNVVNATFDFSILQSNN